MNNYNQKNNNEIKCFPSIRLINKINTFNRGTYHTIREKIKPWIFYDFFLLYKKNYI